MNHIRLASLPFVLILACFLGACGGGSSPSDPGAPDSAGGDGGPAATTKRIAFSKMNSNNPFFEIIAEHMRSEARKHGYEVIVVSAEGDPAKQADQIDDFITQQVDAIVLNPADSKSIGGAVRKANEAGIPVFTSDLECTAEGVKITSHISTDNHQGGKLAGEAMIEVLGDSGGKVGILTHDPADSCIQRVRGFKEVIEAHNKDRASGTIDIVMELPCNGERKVGFNATEAMITTHGDLAAIFAINDPGALGAYAALEKHDKAGQVKIIGFDGQIDGKQAIKEGKIHADPIQFPDRMGRQTIQAIAKYFAGEEVPAKTLIPAELYRKADAEKDPALK